MKRLVIILLTVLTLCGCNDNKTNFYTVTFDVDGGSPLILKQTVEAGGTATAPADPTKTRYVFMFWYLSGICCRI